MSHAPMTTHVVLAGVQEADGCQYDTADGCQYDTADGCQYDTADGCQYDTADGCQYDTADGCQCDTANGCQYDTADGCQYDTADGCQYDTADGCQYDTQGRPYSGQAEVLAQLLQLKMQAAHNQGCRGTHTHAHAHAHTVASRPTVAQGMLTPAARHIASKLHAHGSIRSHVLQVFQAAQVQMHAHQILKGSMQQETGT